MRNGHLVMQKRMQINLQPSPSSDTAAKFVQLQDRRSPKVALHGWSFTVHFLSCLPLKVTFKSLYSRLPVCTCARRLRTCPRIFYAIIFFIIILHATQLPSLQGHISAVSVVKTGHAQGFKFSGYILDIASTVQYVRMFCAIFHLQQHDITNKINLC